MRRSDAQSRNRALPLNFEAGALQPVLSFRWIPALGPRPINDMCLANKVAGGNESNNRQRLFTLTNNVAFSAFLPAAQFAHPRT
jgi:hypothetical protein